MSLRAYLDVLFGGERSGLIELRRTAPAGGMRQEWHRIDQPDVAAGRIVTLGKRGDVFIGVCPRTRQEGGRDAIDHGNVAWVDIDDGDALARLGRFRPRPTVVVRSGFGFHAYWQLAERAGVADLERANRQLAHAIGGDPRSTDAARILRPPASSTASAARLRRFGSRGCDPAPSRSTSWPRGSPIRHRCDGSGEPMCRSRRTTRCVRFRRRSTCRR